MANPYPIQVENTSGVVTTEGAATFTDPGNQPGGGSQPGAVIVSYFPFAFDLADLANGVAFYTPTIGDILLDVWVETDVAWDGTTPKANISTAAFNDGFFSPVTDPVDMTKGPANTGFDTVLLSGYTVNQDLFAAQVGNAGALMVPARFLTADPIVVHVSQDGLAGGLDPGASHGSARVYLKTCTPTLATL